MFKAEMSNGVYYGFGSFKEFYHRVMRNLKYTVHCHSNYDSESAMIYVNGEFVAWLYVTTYTVSIRTFATVNSGTKFICNERMYRK